MAVRARGRAETQRYLQQLPGQMTTVLRGAGRAGGRVIADEAKMRSRSDEVSDNVIVQTKVDDEQVRVTITIRAGWARSLATWLEYGTAAHFISVDDGQRGGKTVRRINDEGRPATLLVNGKPVGATVYHPGAQAHPFLRPALDLKRIDAVAAAQDYIDARVGRPDASPDGDDK